MDDTYLLGAPGTVIPTVPTHKSCLKEVGSMDEDMLQTPDGIPVYGVNIYGVPTGDDDYIAKVLQLKAKKIT
eukprot:1795434-Ditylum_brightwellii.AAC.1